MREIVLTGIRSWSPPGFEPAPVPASPRTRRSCRNTAWSCRRKCWRGLPKTQRRSRWNYQPQKKLRSPQPPRCAGGAPHSAVDSKSVPIVPPAKSILVSIVALRHYHSIVEEVAQQCRCLLMLTVGLLLLLLCWNCWNFARLGAWSCPRCLWERRPSSGIHRAWRPSPRSPRIAPGEPRIWARPFW